MPRKSRLLYLMLLTRITYDSRLAAFVRSLTYLHVGLDSDILIWRLQQLAAIFTWGLHGVLCVQVCKEIFNILVVTDFHIPGVLDNYYLSFPSDPIIRKALVCFIWTLETLHLVLVTQDIYRIFINGFGNYIVPDDLHLLPLTVAIMGGLSMSISHILLLLHTYWLYASSWTHMPSYISISCSSNISVAGYRWVNFNSACAATSQVYCYCHDLTHKHLIYQLSLSSSASAIVFGAKLFQVKTLLGAVDKPSTSPLYLACGVNNSVLVMVKGTDLTSH